MKNILTPEGINEVILQHQRVERGNSSPFENVASRLYGRSQADHYRLEQLRSWHNETYFRRFGEELRPESELNLGRSKRDNLPKIEGALEIQERDFDFWGRGERPIIVNFRGLTPSDRAQKDVSNKVS